MAPRSVRDRQRGRLYHWEDRVVAPHDHTTVPRAAAQGMVNAIWSELGLRYPPKVEALPRQSRRTVADASRLRIRLHEQTPSWCLLHEIAHALTSTHDGGSDQHGPQFVGIYVQLLERYMGLRAADLLPSLEVAGIAVDETARPAFVDGILSD
jgi:hypothetical protein